VIGRFNNTNAASDLDGYPSSICGGPSIIPFPGSIPLLPLQPTSRLSEPEIAMSKFNTPENRGRRGSQDGPRLDWHQSRRPDMKRPDRSAQPRPG